MRKHRFLESFSAQRGTPRESDTASRREEACLLNPLNAVAQLVTSQPVAVDTTTTFFSHLDVLGPSQITRKQLASSFVHSALLHVLWCFPLFHQSSNQDSSLEDEAKSVKLSRRQCKLQARLFLRNSHQVGKPTMRATYGRTSSSLEADPEQVEELEKSFGSSASNRKKEFRLQWARLQLESKAKLKVHTKECIEIDESIGTYEPLDVIIKKEGGQNNPRETAAGVQHAKHAIELGGSSCFTTSSPRGPTPCISRRAGANGLCGCGRP